MTVPFDSTGIFQRYSCTCTSLRRHPRSSPCVLNGWAASYVYWRPIQSPRYAHVGSVPLDGEGPPSPSHGMPSPFHLGSPRCRPLHAWNLRLGLGCLRSFHLRCQGPCTIPAVIHVHKLLVLAFTPVRAKPCFHGSYMCARAFARCEGHGRRRQPACISHEVIHIVKVIVSSSSVRR